MLHQHALDLDRGDVFAGAADDVLLAVDEMKRAIRAAPHHVAGMKPAAVPGLRGGLGILEILAEEAVAGCRAGMAHQKFAGLVDAGLCAAIGNDAGLEFASQAAEAACAGVARLGGGDDHGTGAGLGHGPGLDQRKAEPGLERIMQRLVDTGAKTEAHAVALVVGCSRAAPISIGGITPR